MADIPAFYGRLQKQITMKTDGLSPREMGLKPTHFIDVWDAGEDDLYYGSNPYADCNANDPDIQPIQELDIWVNKHTIAIFKIYPKHK